MSDHLLFMSDFYRAVRGNAGLMEGRRGQNRPAPSNAGSRIIVSAATREKNTFKRGKNLFWHLMEHTRLPHTPHFRGL